MYKNPINIIYDEVQYKLENEVLKAVQNLNISIDENELKKALAYNIDQYKKGYNDAMNDSWTSCGLLTMPKSEEDVIVTILDDSGDTPLRYTACGWYLEDAKCWIVNNEARTDIIAWMSLPKPYAKI